MADKARAGGEVAARGALARVLVHALADYAVVERRAAQEIQRAFCLAGEQAVADAQEPGVRRVGAAYLGELAVREAVCVIARAYHAHRIEPDGVVVSAEAEIGEKQQRAGRLVVDVAVPREVGAPDEVFPLRAVRRAVLADCRADALRPLGKPAVFKRPEPREGAEGAPDEDVVICEIRVSEHVVGGHEEGLIELDCAVALALERAQYAPDGGPDALEREHALVARGLHIALEGYYGRG